MPIFATPEQAKKRGRIMARLLRALVPEKEPYQETVVRPQQGDAWPLEIGGPSESLVTPQQVGQAERTQLLSDPQRWNRAMQAATFPAPIVYHGSPHIFEKFDVKKIGTGEGAQAYGHGLYFTSEPKVAEGYRRSLASSPHEGTIYIGDTRMTDYYTKHGITGNSIAGDVLNDLRRAIMGEADAAKGIAQVRKNYEKYVNDPEVANLHTNLHDNAKRSLEWLNRMEKEGVRYETRPGALYAADIPENVLHWDKPLAEQSPEILSALEQGNIIPKGTKQYLDTLAKLDEISSRPATKIGTPEDAARKAEWDSVNKELATIAKRLGPESGAQVSFDPEVAASLLRHRPMGYKGSELYRDVSADPTVASEKLKALGIPGHSYIGDTSGVRNYVMYSDEPVKTVGRWSSLEEMKKAQAEQAAKAKVLRKKVADE